jgi:hypothetical protein
VNERIHVAERLGDCGGVPYVAQVVRAAPHNMIENNGLMNLLSKFLDNVRTYKTASPGNKHSHCFLP